MEHHVTSSATTSDEALLASVASGDEDALRVLYARHASGVLRLARRLASQRGVAEEIAQEAWVAIWQSAGTFRHQASVRAWLLGVARRQAHNMLRHRGFDLVSLAKAPDPEDSGRGAEELMLARDGHERLVAAITGLPAHLRETVILAWVDELPYRDVAAVLGVPQGTVKSRVSHARARLAAVIATMEV